MGGGDLLDYINQHPPNMRGLSTTLSAQLLWMMLSGIAYLNHWRFVHRDIKPANYMLKMPIESGQRPVLKLIDFGLSRTFNKGEMMQTRCGTPQYCAPEILRGSPYDMSCDIWSIGCTCVTMIVGDKPLPGAMDNE